MTTDEAIQKLIAFDPNRTWCVEKAVWSHKGDTQKRPTYTVSALPGASGKECSRWQAESFEQAAENAIQALTPAPAVTDIQPNNE